MKGFGEFCLGLILITAETIYGGWILSVLWGWFMVSTFSLPQLRIPEAIGLVLVGRFFRSHITKTDTSVWKEIGDAFLLSTVILGIGWIVQLFI